MKRTQTPLFRRRRVRLVALGVFIVLVLWGLGRLTQKYVQSLYFGERAPYLQMVTDNNAVIRWQTEEAQPGVVWFGDAPGGLTQQVAETEGGKAHELRLTGLKPGRRYFYKVGSAAGVRWGTDGDYWFYTAPTRGQPAPVRFWVIGDSGRRGEGQRAVRDSALAWMNDHPRPDRPLMDLWLALGDNAYTSGKADEYQENFFEPYAGLLKNFEVWPVYGNHDARRWVFYDVFTLPVKGEGGGLASHTESYYSFDYGDVHFVVLDSEASDLGRDGPMLRWLRQDLAANHQPWLVAAFHHPPYTRGGHDSDNRWDSGGRLMDMRANALPILEAAGADLVLSGHSHVYERSHLVACHYGTSDTLTEGMVLDRNGSDYRKPSGAAGAAGTIYAVVGSSSKLDQGALNHPVMKTAMSELGSLVVDVTGERLEARFIDSQGRVRDSFDIVKGAPAERPRTCP